jgi:hypothetical protein
MKAISCLKLGAVWCDQLISSVSKTIFAINNQKNDSLTERMKIFESVFIDKTNLNLQKEKFVDFDYYNIDAQITENSIYLPELQTFEGEKRRYMLKLSDKMLAQTEFRLITDLPRSGFIVYACNETVGFRCQSLNHVLYHLPYPYNDDFKLIFKLANSTVSDARKEWQALILNLESISPHNSILIEFNPEQKGFFFADINYIHPNTKNYNDWKVSYFGLEWATIKPISIHTKLNFPSLNDKVFKYKFNFRIDDAANMAFPPRLMQRVGKEFKPIISYKQSVLSFYEKIDSVLNRGIEIDVWIDPVVDTFEFNISLDYYATLSLFTARYKSLLLAQSIVVMYFLYNYTFKGNSTVD